MAVYHIGNRLAHASHASPGMPRIPEYAQESLILDGANSKGWNSDCAQEPPDAKIRVSCHQSLTGGS